MKQLLLLVLTVLNAHAEPGITNDKILIGQSSNSQPRAKALTQGAKLYFDTLNAKGGINGRKVEIAFVDDDYDPQKSVALTQQLIEEKKVFALFQAYGTAQARAIYPLVERNDIPLFAPISGSELLRTPVNKNVFTVQPSHLDASSDMLHFLVGKGIKEICILAQDDPMGNEGKNATSKAMLGLNLKPSAISLYKKNTVDVDPAVEEMKKAGCKGVIMWAQTAAGLEMIKKAKAAGLDATFMGSMVVSTNEFFADAGGYSPKVYVAMTVPPYKDKSVPLAAQYMKDITAAKGKPDPSSFEGYVNAAIFAKAATMAGKDLTRDSFRNALNTKLMDHDLGGILVHYSTENHQALKSVYLAHVKAGGALEAAK